MLTFLFSSGAMLNVRVVELFDGTGSPSAAKATMRFVISAAFESAAPRLSDSVSVAPGASVPIGQRRDGWPDGPLAGPQPRAPPGAVPPGGRVCARSRVG